MKWPVIHSQSVSYRLLFPLCCRRVNRQLQLFEWAITLDLEVALIWNTPWNFTKIAFLVNRYLPAVDFVLSGLRK